MSEQERINRLENTVKHLVQLELDKREYEEMHSKMTMKEFYRKEQEHKEIFRKFLYQVVE